MININKKTIIDLAFNNLIPEGSSFVDLGGVWGVNGIYTFYIMDTYNTGNSFLVDIDISDITFELSQDKPKLKIIQGDFGDDTVVTSIGKIDVVLMFDILLHQVEPDWDEILKKYSNIANYFIIYNPQWIGSDKTIRLLDLGKEGYFKNVPHKENEFPYNHLFNDMDSISPEHKKVWKNIHAVWQWGITNNDLINVMTSLGFEMSYHKNFGQFGYLQNFEEHGFIFRKQSC